ncbi:MAG: selenocysteine-specific translation elongation factor [Clostridiaceae bacterium]
MKHVVIGTAGHIDHGKTALVKRLTGVDADRLEEEKRRGMTIELGFAPLKLPSGNVISIVDVPGHEKFIKTMVAGVTGIDFVMMVIAADEGIMPQTREHLDILSLLNIKSGVVALTKMDLVEDGWLEMVIESTKSQLKGTFLEECDIIPVSSVTGEGIDELLEKLEELMKAAADGESQEFFRMPIDRVFTIQGYGTVITGTSLGGEVKKGDMIKILPSGITSKIRGIQVHNKTSEAADAGQRCALNISGVEKSSIERGDTALSEDWIRPVTLVDAVVYTIKGKFDIENNQRVHVNIGTKDVLARIKVIGAEKIPGGSKGYVQLKFEDSVVALREDRFIIREFSPVRTLGGGKILSHFTRNRGRFRQDDIEAFEIAESGDIKALIKQAMKFSGKPLSADEIWHMVLGKKRDVKNSIQEELVSGEIIGLRSSGKYISRYICDEYMKMVDEEFDDLYKKYPFKFEIDKEEIKSRLFSNMDGKDFSDLINYYMESGTLILENNMIRKKSDDVIRKIMGAKEVKFLEDMILHNGMNLKNSDQIKKEIDSAVNKSMFNNCDDILKVLMRLGKIINLGNDILMHHNLLQDNVNKIREMFRNNESVTTVFIRDCLQCSRKTAISILEYLDTLGVTERHGDVRRPGVHYMDFFYKSAGLIKKKEGEI